jgi:phage shock protein PspC (stress-responsive transcriptional regulator)
MMKKALQISIAGTLFTIEDDAFARLEGYLASVKAHFKHTEGADEIIADIESRIAEQLHESKEHVVTLKTVEQVLEQMGKVEDFDDTESSHTEKEDAGILQIGGKKLYRNPDDRYIAGVCSGLAAYFGIDAVWVRLAFVVLTFFNGFGILLYIILWIIMPEAKTGGQKLEMTGTPVNLETISETVRERVSEVKANHSALRSIIAVPFQIIGAVITFVFSILGPALRIVVGTLLIVIGTGLLVGLLFLSGFLISGANWMMSDIPVDVLLPGSLYYFTITSVTLAGVIPLLFVLFAGISLLQRRSALPAPIGLGMLGTWFVTLLVSGFCVSSAIGNYMQHTRVSPSQMSTSTAISVGDTYVSENL